MPHLGWANAALVDVARLREFLMKVDASAASRAIRTIREGVKQLERHPATGRIVEDVSPNVRELILPFGHGTYLVRYRVTAAQITVLRIRHSRESTYPLMDE